jgi:hypothetical protein
VANGERRDQKVQVNENPEVQVSDDIELVNCARRFASVVNQRLGLPSAFEVVTEQPSQQEICDAIFATIAAGQQALIANGCAGA